MTNVLPVSMATRHVFPANAIRLVLLVPLAVHLMDSAAVDYSFKGGNATDASQASTGFLTAKGASATLPEQNPVQEELTVVLRAM